jgi:hypothetical protein
MLSYAETPTTGLLLMADGFGPMLRWNSLTFQAEPAGVLPPTTAPTLGFSGSGAIVGNYFAYVRFVDQFGNVSNLSPISNEITAAGSSGTITDATNATPIVFEAIGHGLTSGATVSVSGVGGNTSANNVWTITVVDADHFSADGSSGTASYTGGGAWISGVSTIAYSNVPTPTEPKVVRRQILRNTDGQAQTFYVDVDTTDLTSASFTSTQTDVFLAAGIAQAILDSNGLPLANTFNVPPNHKAVIEFHINRMFAAVEEDYVQGSIQTTYGSAVVQGIGTEWNSSLTNRFLWVVGASQPYQVMSVDTVNQKLTLTVPYSDSADLFAQYAIRPAPAERRLLYYSLSGLPEAWPVTNAISVQEDGDEHTGLMSKGSFLYILEKRHIYRFTFQGDPAVGGAIFLSALRGCINNRCWVLVDDTAYMLDEQGIHAFSGGETSEPISNQIQDIFRPNSPSNYRVNWRASRGFHAAHYPPQECIRWFVALSGSYLPRHAICYNYRLKRWWLEEFAYNVGASAVGRAGGIPTLFLGGPARRVFAFWQGFLDGPNASMGTVRGAVTSATLFSITDTAAVYAGTGLVGSPFSIVTGAGKYQTRLISGVSGQTLLFDEPFLQLPDTTSVYQIGGIHWRFQSGWFRFVNDEESNQRRLELVFSPTINPATLDMRLRIDFSSTAYAWGVDRRSSDGSGVQVSSGSPDLVVDLTKPTGIAQHRLPSHKEFYLDGKRYTQPELEGFTNNDQVTILQLTYDGVVITAGGR